jgi:hypothetical protein
MKSSLDLHLPRISSKVAPYLVIATALVAAISTGLLSRHATAQSRYFNDGIEPDRKNPIRLRDAANRECITIKGRVRGQAINKTIVDHYLDVTNICPKIIRVKACYVTSTRCVEFDVRSRESKEVLLGVATANPSTPFFRFDFTEKSLF